MERSLGIALLGAGTVGAAVAREFHDHADRLAARSGGPLQLRHLAVRDPRRDRGINLKGVAVGDDPVAAISAGDVDIVVELIGGLEPAGSLMATAIERGCGVVTANKAVIAAAGPTLGAHVRPGSGGLAFEAAVGAGIPVLAMLRDSLQGDRIRRITAVVNGTTNYILERIRLGDSFDSALAEARHRGYAESDPRADLDGDDAAAKLSILAWFAMGANIPPDEVEQRGIRNVDRSDALIAEQLDSVVRLVARAERTDAGVALSVQPTMLPRAHPLGVLEGAENAIVIESDLAGRILLRGRGAGAGASASAVLSDVVAVARARREGRSLPLPPASPAAALDMETAETSAALRLRVTPDPEAPAIVAQMLEDRGIEVAHITAARGGELLVLTETASRAVLGRALETLDTVPAVISVQQVFDRLEAAV